jgi:hypothetical protein
MKTSADQRLYWVWGSMIQRCHNPRSAGYQTYGAKGVRVCARWRRFEAFKADMGIPEPGMSLDRIDSTKDYEPTNCRWATRLEQNRNRPSWCLSVDGKSLRELWEQDAHPSVSYRNFRKRLRLRRWSLTDALTRPERGSGELHGYRRTTT